MPLDRDAAPIPNPAAVLREFSDGWAMLVNLDTGASIALNPTATLIWRLLDGRRTASELIAEIRRLHRSTPGSVENDVEQLVDLFLEDGFAGVEISRQSLGPETPPGHPR